MVKYLRISSYIRKPFLIYDFATAPILVSLNIFEEDFVFFLINVHCEKNRKINLSFRVQCSICTVNNAAETTCIAGLVRSLNSWSQESELKGTGPRDLFHESVSPKPRSTPLEPSVSKIFENSQRHSQLKVHHTGVVYTGGKRKKSLIRKFLNFFDTLG